MRRKKKKKRSGGFRRSWPKYVSYMQDVKLRAHMNDSLWRDNYPEIIQGLMQNIFFSQEDLVVNQTIHILSWEHKYTKSDDAVILFPRNTEVVSAIHNLKLRLAPKDLRILPELIEIRWPCRTKIGNYELLPVLVINTTPKEIRNYVKDFCLELATNVPYENIELFLANDREHDDEPILIINQTSKNVDLAPLMIFNHDNIEKLLQSEAPEYYGSDDDYDQEFFDNFRLLSLMAVKTAFYSLTGNATNDLPQQYLPKEDKITFTLNLPKTTKDAQRISPSMHWRHEHPRRYPIRIDGTRRDGTVLVRGAVINKEKKAKTLH